ncbi:MAG: VCBS repeat-containing protein [Reichenbachiella sp.]
MKSIILSLFLTLSYYYSFAQFNSIEENNIPKLIDGDIKFGDIDLDGDIDCIISGFDGVQPITRVMINEGSNNYSVLNVDIINLTQSKIVLVDFTKDRFLDLFISGIDDAGNSQFRIYKNLKGESFEDINTSIATFDNGDFEVFDINSDGDLDVLITGLINGNIQTRFYFSDGNQFYNQEFYFDGLVDSKIVVADFTNDSRKDIIIQGKNIFGQNETKRFIQGPGGRYIVHLDVPLNIPHIDAIEKGDFNSDGYDDLVQFGFSLLTWQFQTSIFWGKEFGFEKTPSVYPAVDFNRSRGFYFKILEVIDIDQDGDDDILQAGVTETGVGFHSLINDGTGNFEIQQNDLEINYGPDIRNEIQYFAFGDIDQDGELEVLVRFVENVVDEIGNPIGGDFFNTFFTLENGTWSTIETVDPLFEGGPFEFINVESKPPLLVFSGISEAGLIESKIYSIENNQYLPDLDVFTPINLEGSLAVGDIDQDDDDDLVFALVDNNTTSIILYEYDNNTFSHKQTIIMDQSYWENSVQLVDANGDGVKDISINTGGIEGVDSQLILYESMENGQISNERQLIYSASSSRIASSVWLNLNDDNTSEVFFNGLEENGVVSVVNLFKRVDDDYRSIIENFPKLNDGDIATCDHNKDGLLDALIVSGNMGPSILLLGTGNGSFDQYNLDIGLYQMPRILSLDYDLDGSDDIIISEFSENAEQKTFGFSNTGDTTFVKTFELEGLSNGGISLVDFNSDKILDVFISGKNSQGVFKNYIYENQIGYTNELPNSPIGLSAEIDENEVVFSWSSVPEAHSYNLEILSNSGAYSYLSSDSTGKRINYSRGNSGASNSLTIDVDQGSYWARVQSIDNQYIGSAYSDSITFQIDTPIDDSPYRKLTIDEMNDFDLDDSKGFWADMNNDHYPDFITIGKYNNSDSSEDYYFLVFENTGSNDLKLSLQSPIQRPSEVDIQISDLNNDGLADFIFQNILFKNEGNMQFIRSEIPIVQYLADDAKLVDIDNDGFTDINFNSITLINLGDFVFSSMDTFDGYNPTEVKWGDIDGDSDLDAFIVEEINANTGETRLSLLLNNGNGDFHASDISFDNTVALHRWGFIDYNQDGQLDMYHFFFDNDYGYVFYLNNDMQFDIVNDQALESINFEFSPQFPFQFVDIDGDGDFDFNNQVGELFRNEGESFELVERYNFKMSWADIDLDGDVDFQLGSNVYLNRTNQISASPSVPINLRSEKKDEGYLLSWDQPDGDRGYGYSLEVYKDDELFISAKNYGLGSRDASLLGNAGINTNYYIKDLPVGKYSFKVQAINIGLMSSSFSDFQTFSVDYFDISILHKLENIRISSLATADMDNDGDLDLLVSPDPSSLEIFSGLLINENGSFDEVFNLSEYGILSGKPCLADINHDGFIDIIGNFNDISKILYNKGNLNFEEYLLEGIEAYSEFEVLDIDGDGIKDLLFDQERRFSNDKASYIWYRQDDLDGDFSLGNGIDSTFYFPQQIVTGDYDLDGDMDVFVSGNYESAFVASREGEDILYQNDGSGNFLQVFDNFSGHLGSQGGSTAAFVDLTQDGFVDLVFRGAFPLVLEGDAIGKLDPIDVDFPPSSGPSISGDFDGDGDFDVVFINDYDGISYILENYGGAAFKKKVFEAPPISTGFNNYAVGVSGDFDNDGRLDLIVCGEEPSRGDFTTYLITNTNGAISEPPMPPLNLQSSAKDSIVSLSWSANDILPTYNLSITNEFGIEVLSAEASSSGGQLMPKIGNMSYRKSHTMSLPDGEYTWKVQSVNAAFQGSEFIEGESFVICSAFESISFGFSVIGSEELAINSEVQFVDTSRVEGLTYLWDFGDASTSTEVSPSHAYTMTGEFNVSLLLSNSLGCKVSVSSTVRVEEGINVRIANIITPNGDGKNDFLYIENIERYPNNTLSFYSATGALLYSASGYNNDWYAKVGGNYLPSGSYMCVLKIDQFSTQIQQSISIMR